MEYTEEMCAKRYMSEVCAVRYIGGMGAERSREGEAGMRIHSAAEVGVLVRERRRQKRMTQQALAEAIGVDRRWVIGVEKGNPTASLQLVLHALNALGVELRVVDPEAVDVRQVEGTDLNAVVARSRRR